MKDKAAVCTVAVVLAVTEPEVAEIATEPKARAVASPPGAMDTILFMDEAQVTDAVTSSTLPSENVPAAVNCWWVPRNKTASSGVMTIETKVTLLAMTVRVAVEEMFPERAEIVETPAASALARPRMPPAFILATATVPEVQLTAEVISR